MKQEMNYSKYVDRYLDGIMSVDEQLWFETELAHDKKLQEEVRLQKNLQKMLAEKEVLDLESQLDGIYEQTYRPWRTSLSSFPKNIKNSFNKYTVAAASITLVVITAVSLLGKHGKSGSELYYAHYEPAEISMSFRAGAEDINADLREAMTFYENRDYAEAILLFEKVLEKDNSRIGLNLYSGISHMEIEEYAQANESFNKIIDHKANAFIESAEWYLGLCYLKTNKNEKAFEVFGEIVERDGYFKKDAKKIIKKLE